MWGKYRVSVKVWILLHSSKLCLHDRSVRAHTEILVLLCLSSALEAAQAQADLQKCKCSSQWNHAKQTN